MKKLPLFFFLIGVICLVLLVRSIGLAVLLGNLKQIGWGILVVIAAELVVDACNTRGWWHIFPVEARTVPLPLLYCIRQAGAAVNAITPTATVGGEVVKAVLLKRYLPFSEGLASVISSKLSLALGQALFALVGLAIFSHRLAVSLEVKVALVATLLVTLGGCLLFLHVQRRGLFAWFFRFTSGLGLSFSGLTRLREKAATIDEKISSLHATRRTDFTAAVFFHFLAQGVGAVQIFLLLFWLEVPVDFLTCVAIEALSLLIDGALFFVPGKLGVQEGGKVVIFTALGFTAATGLTVGVALRLNQLALIVLGLISLVVLNASQVSVRSAGDDKQPVLDG